MKTLLAGLLGLLLATNFVQADQDKSLSFGDRTRTYRVHTPIGYTGKVALPLVLNFHGGGGNAAAAQVQTKMNATSDKYGFILVYPNGTGPIGSKLLTWNAGICCDYAVLNKVDDVGFVRKLLDELPKSYKIDPKRVYATGMSNGGMMAYRLACELPDRFAAICSVSCSMGVDGPVPSRPVAIMEVHGRLDPNAPFAGGIGPNAISKVTHKPVLEVMDWWKKANNCQNAAVVNQANDIYIYQLWSPILGQKGAMVALYEIINGGHSWPGGVDVTKNLGTGPFEARFDTNEYMWRFFRLQTLK